MEAQEVRPGSDVEESLNKLISSRHSPQDARRIAEAWAESVRTTDLRDQAEIRQAWAEYYRIQIRAAESARERAEARLRRLMPDEGVDA